MPNNPLCPTNIEASYFPSFDWAYSPTPNLAYNRNHAVADIIIIKIIFLIFINDKFYHTEASNAEITGPKITAVFDSRGGLSVAREHGVQK